MKGIIVNFRGSHKTKYSNHIIIQVGKEAENVVGKTIVWKSPAGKEIKGKVTNIHGQKGAVRAIFEKGLPGQCLGQGVEIE